MGKSTCMESGSMYSKNTSGNCPYCGKNDFDNSQDVTTHPNQTSKKCNGCSKWSMRHANGSQFPLRDNDDPHSDSYK